MRHRELDVEVESWHGASLVSLTWTRCWCRHHDPQGGGHTAQSWLTVAPATTMAHLIMTGSVGDLLEEPAPRWFGLRARSLLASW